MKASDRVFWFAFGDEHPPITDELRLTLESPDLQVRQFFPKELVDSVFAVIDSMTQGTQWEHLVANDPEQGCAQLVFWTTWETYMFCRVQWHEAARWIARNVPTVTNIGLEEMLARLSSDDSQQRQVGASIAEFLGEIVQSVDDATNALICFATAGDHRLRLAAITALMHIRSAKAIPVLIACLDDRDSEIQSIAAIAVGTFGRLAHAAVARLSIMIQDSSQSVRLTSLVAIGWILVHETDRLAELAPRLKSLLHDPDSQVRQAALVLLDLVPSERPSLLPGLLAVWRAPCVDDSLPQNWSKHDKYILGRRRILSMLATMTPRTGDDDLNDFIFTFLACAFHPEWRRFIPNIVSHSWYSKVQLSQLRKLPVRYAGVSPALYLSDDASQQFAERLLRNPTLGITPERVAELPGYIRNHASDVAKLLHRQLLRQSAASLSEESLERIQPILQSRSMRPDDAAILSEVREQMFVYVDEEFSPPAREVFRLRILGGMEWERVAEQLNRTVNQVRYLMDEAIIELAEHLHLPLDRGSMLKLAELLGRDSA